MTRDTESGVECALFPVQGGTRPPARRDVGDRKGQTPSQAADRFDPTRSWEVAMQAKRQSLDHRVSSLWSWAQAHGKRAFASQGS